MSIISINSRFRKSRNASCCSSSSIMSLDPTKPHPYWQTQNEQVCHLCKNSYLHPLHFNPIELHPVFLVDQNTTCTLCSQTQDAPVHYPICLKDTQPMSLISYESSNRDPIVCNAVSSTLHTIKSCIPGLGGSSGDCFKALEENIVWANKAIMARDYLNAGIRFILILVVILMLLYFFIIPGLTWSDKKLKKK